ncbi:hypothetical protein CRG98_028119 [Punica granatum]|uniref:Amidase domain-containing protein n=1 Tax=Punica granatum TaxID=22663 RepID=A0A2I0J5Q9_PUNGR|nr:hypothetical protein CRG98_028119 [Punica granatum]
MKKTKNTQVPEYVECHPMKTPIFDVEGQVTGFGNPDWARTHSAACSTAPSVLAVLEAGATCVGKTVMDEMAYSINGENKHYGTPRNPCAPDRVPGGSSSGSAVAVGAMLVDFSLGTDTGGSVRVPASYCGIYGFRPSHDVVSTSGVIPMAQSFDTVGHVVKKTTLGDYVKDNVPSLDCFLSKGGDENIYNIPSLAALSSAMRLLQRSRSLASFAFNWIVGLSRQTGILGHRAGLGFENMGMDLPGLGHDLDDSILVIPTVPGHPPKLQTDPSTLEIFRARAFSLLAIAGVSGFCQCVELN